MGLNFWTSLVIGAIGDIFTNLSSTNITTTINATGGRTGGPSLRFSTGSGGVTGRRGATLITPGPTQWGPMAYRTSALPPSVDRVIFEYRESSSVQVDIRVTPTGNLRFTRAGTTLATSTFQVVFPNVYLQFDPKVVVHNSAGTIDVRLSGNPAGIPGLIGLTGLDTQATANATVNEVAYCCVSGNEISGTITDHCDLSVRDDDWTGDARIGYLPFSVAGTYSDFVPSAGANETTIEELGVATADHNASQVVGDKDSFTGGTIPTTATVIATCPIMLHNKQDAGAAEDKFLFRQGGVDYTTGAAFNPPFGSDQYVKEAYLLNPATAAAFTPTEINGTLERGYTRSA